MRRALVGFCIAFLSAQAHAIDLGDLNLPASRLPEKQDGTPGWISPADVGHPVDTSGWTPYDLTDSNDMAALGCGTAIANDAADDGAVIQCAINSEAGAAARVLTLPRGKFMINQRIRFEQDDDFTVLRGEGMTATILQIRYDASAQGAADFPECRSVGVISMCATGAGASDVTDSTAWLGGTAKDSMQITVSDGSAYSIGDWVRLTGEPANAGLGWNDDDVHFWMMARIVYKPSVNVFNLDVRIPVAMTGGSSLTVAKPAGILEQAGIEGLSIQGFPGHPATDAVLPHDLSIEWCDTCWVRSVRMENNYTKFMDVRRSRFVLVESSVFDDLSYNASNFGSAIYVKQSNSNFFENNVGGPDIHRFFTIENGQTMNVFAYNFMANGDNDIVCARPFFLHGDNPTANLLEGNHVDCGRMEEDNWWGRQGEYNTWFRNRHAAPNRCHRTSNGTIVGGSVDAPTSTCVTDSDCNDGVDQYCAPYSREGIVTEIGNPKSHGVVSIDNNWVLNAASSFHDWQGSHCKAGGVNVAVTACKPNSSFDAHPSPAAPPALEGFWLERNLARNFNLNPANGDPNSDCGTGTGKSDCPGTNVEGNTLSCSELTLPVSLYREVAPSWWCQEACPWETTTGIGACGDDVTPGNLHRLCKLPAQILAEGGTCTPLIAAARAVPEPGALLSLVSGAALLGLLYSRRKANA